MALYPKVFSLRYKKHPIDVVLTFRIRPVRYGALLCPVCRCEIKGDPGVVRCVRCDTVQNVSVKSEVFGYCVYTSVPSTVSVAREVSRILGVMFHVRKSNYKFYSESVELSKSYLARGVICDAKSRSDILTAVRGVYSGLVLSSSALQDMKDNKQVVYELKVAEFPSFESLEKVAEDMALRKMVRRI